MAELFDTLLYRIEETYPEEKTSRLFYTSMKYLFTKYNPSYNRGVDLELYKKHCYRFISILVEFEADYNTIIAAMLYPIYYHNATDRKEVQLLVGEEVETLVYDIYELDQFHFDMNLQKMNLESLRSMFLIASHDLRAMYIYILDIYTRLLLYKESLYDISDSMLKEILYIYAPIAAQMGLWQIKEKMEDIAFEMMYPEQYQRVQSLLYEEKELSEKFLHAFEEDIKQQLDTIGISYTVTSRTKHIYSLYKKMILKGLSIDQVYDLFAIRIITQTELDCYKVLTLLHSHFQPDVSRIKDYIAVPKSNGYRSIHTTLTIDDIHKVEVQVRTEEMDREASVGQAAHFIYSNFKKSQRMTDQQRKLHESLNNTLQDIQYGKSSHIDTVFENTIFVTLNKKKIVSVDNGMVLGDFLKKQYPYSYRKLAQPKINKKKQKDSYVLQNGDMIETRFQTGFFITVR